MFWWFPSAWGPLTIIDHAIKTWVCIDGDEGHKEQRGAFFKKLLLGSNTGKQFTGTLKCGTTLPPGLLLLAQLQVSENKRPSSIPSSEGAHLRKRLRAPLSAKLATGLGPVFLG